ncbi:hypothetical protein HY480_02020, partial [Candidatus Uhrbacteria bacterium]|nr:hypothetical protein [Candidatus Uhrbacteria bacterium]
TLKLTIDRPFAVLLSALTVGILPEHLWSNIPPTHLALADLNLRPIGSGPFRFTMLTKDKRGSVRSYTMERYTGYHRTPAFLERITVRFFPDQEQLLAAFNGREVDGIGTLAAIPPNTITRRDVTTHTTQFPSTTAIFLNPRRDTAVRDVLVRRALDAAVDRPALVTEVLRGSGTAIGGPLIIGFSPDADPPSPEPFNPTKAEELLDRAKWTRVPPEQFLTMRTQAGLRALEEEKKKQVAAMPRNQRPKTVPPVTDEERSAIETRVRTEFDAACTGCTPLPYVRVRNGEALAVTMTTADIPELVAMAAHIRDGWRSIGIRATVDALPIERLRAETIPTRAYDALLFSQVLGPDPDPFPFWHSSQVRSPGLNLAAFTNKTIDKLLEDARATMDHAVRAQKYAAFQKILAEERPAIFLTTPTVAYPITSAVHGVRIGKLTTPADRFATITEWYIATDREWRNAK